MNPYKRLSESKRKKLAKDPEVTTNTIMSWYKDADGTMERVDMVLLMKERIDVCIAEKKNW